ncbi:uncharacterized protein PV09_09869, partial [Verruconis gallopava]
LAAPKTEHVARILSATHDGELGVAEIFRSLDGRMMDSSWTTVFKSLIVIHTMIREGRQNTTLKHLASNSHQLLAINDKGTLES